MIKKISKSEEVIERLRKESKGAGGYLDQTHHVAAITAMNTQLEQVRREFQVKDKNSQATAAQVVLNS